MRRAEHAVFNGQAGKCSAELHSSASFEIAGIVKDSRQIWDGELKTFVGEGERERVALLCDGGFDDMRDGVDAGAGCDLFWLRKRQARIEYGDAGGGLG